MTAAGNLAVAVGHPVVVASHASAIVVYWIHVACSDSYWGSTATAFTPDRAACHHFYDSSCTAQWASELGTTTSIVSFFYRVGVLWCALQVTAPQFTPLQTGFTLAQTSWLLVPDTIVFRSLGATFSELTGQPKPSELHVPSPSIVAPITGTTETLPLSIASSEPLALVIPVES